MLGCQRLQFKTDVRNLRSRAAIARLGALEEGIVRAERRRVDGSLRDSVQFSILASEWDSVKAHLRGKLKRAPEQTSQPDA